jgi:hypothetical protein
MITEIRLALPKHYEPILTHLRQYMNGHVQSVRQVVYDGKTIKITTQGVLRTDSRHAVVAFVCGYLAAAVGVLFLENT